MRSGRGARKKNPMVKLLVGSGRLYLHAERTAMPAVNANPTAAGWTDLGAIEGGVSVAREQTLKELFVDDETGPVDVARTAEALVLQASLAEPTLTNLGKALTGAAPTTGAGPPTTETLGGYRGATVARHALLFRAGSPEGPGKTGQTYVPRGYFAGDLGMAHRKDEQTVVPVEFRALVDANASTPAERFGLTVYET